jgi:uncharacterized membrane protein
MPALSSGSLSIPTIVAFAVHILAGTIGLLTGVVAASSMKGGWLHRRAGTVFVVAMLAMAVSADYLAVVRRGQLLNLVIGTFALYLIATAWLAVRRNEGTTGFPEKIAFAVILVLCIPFLVLSFQITAGLPLLFKSAVPIEGPVLIALYVFTAVFVLAALGDARLLLAGGIRGRARIERHLWRMLLGLAMAAGSAFTNGLPRLLPKGVHVPLILLFVPQLLALGALVFWLVRVRFTRWYDGEGELHAAPAQLTVAATD